MSTDTTTKRYGTDHLDLLDGKTSLLWTIRMDEDMAGSINLQMSAIVAAFESRHGGKAKQYMGVVKPFDSVAAMSGEWSHVCHLRITDRAQSNVSIFDVFATGGILPTVVEGEGITSEQGIKLRILAGSRE